MMEENTDQTKSKPSAAVWFIMINHISMEQSGFRRRNAMPLANRKKFVWRRVSFCFVHNYPHTIAQVWSTLFWWLTSLNWLTSSSARYSSFYLGRRIS